MRKKRGLFALLAGVVAMTLCLAAASPAHAHEVVDTSRTGSVAVSLSYEGDPVGGGSLTLYRVGSVVEGDGNFSFAPTSSESSAVERRTLSRSSLAWSCVTPTRRKPLR